MDLLICGWRMELVWNKQTISRISSLASSPSRNMVLMAVLVVAISVSLLVPEQAYSTLTFTGYSNSTSTTGGSSQSTNSTGTTYTTDNNSTSQSTNSTGTTYTTDNNSTSQSTNSTNSSSTTQTNSNMTFTSSNATNTASISSSTESSSPTPASSESSQVNSESGSGSIDESSPVTSSQVTTSSNEAVISPSIVVSTLNSLVNNTNASSVISSSTVYTGTPILPDALLLSNDQSYYAYGDVVTLTASLPGMSLQNIAMVVSDPTGNDIVARTVTTDNNGTAQLQFKIPSNFATGVYQDIATAMVDGKNYTNSTTFNVIKTHGIIIDSVQLIDQQGNPVSMIKKGQNNFVQVSISSGETMPALITMNLFDTNQTSIGTASIKSNITPGDSQMTLSFFIPPTAQVGASNIFTDAYSDWPANGGTPLTTESCLSATLQDPTTLPVSYQPPQPQSCTQQHPQNLTGTTFVANQSPMTNSQAQVTLGVAIQNDSMTFMNPTQAQLLALAYQNGTATNSGTKSIALINLNLNQLNATGLNSTATNLGGTSAISNFTTIAGPALQNDPMALKILQEIQTSKRQIANIIGNETADQINNELIQKQRVAAASQLKQDLTALAQSDIATSPSVAYASFLSTVPDNRTQAVFQGEFNFMEQRVAAANAAMQSVLANGGSLDQAVQTFDNYAAIRHSQIVQINDNLNVEYGLANSNVQSCFDSNGDLTMVNGSNPCLANLENNSTNSSGIQIVSVQPTDQNGNKVSLFTRGQSGYVRVDLYSSYTAPTLVTVNLFDSNLDTLGASSAKYTLNPGNSEVVLPYYVPLQSSTGLASIYADALTGWPNNGGTSESHEQSYFVGIS